MAPPSSLKGEAAAAANRDHRPPHTPVPRWAQCMAGLEGIARCEQLVNAAAHLLDIVSGVWSPRAAAAQATSQESAPPPLPIGLRVLIVDDSRVTRDLLTRTFKVRFKWVCSEATLGQEAMDRIIEKGEQFDIIVIDKDFGRDNPNGIEVAAALRKVDPRLIIVGCSSDNTIEQGVQGESASQLSTTNRAFYAAGADVCWPKPFPDARTGKMQGTLHRHLQRLARSSKSGRGKSVTLCA